ncbi:MAG: hypothetical protein RQ732_09490 [Methylophaga sp.]|nr:hypothetical protein [Methylophaga sp.]
MELQSCRQLSPHINKLSHSGNGIIIIRNLLHGSIWIPACARMTQATLSKPGAKTLDPRMREDDEGIIKDGGFHLVGFQYGQNDIDKSDYSLSRGERDRVRENPARNLHSVIHSSHPVI